MIQELVVLSGKGGTGKTSLTASFAALAQDCILCDADVDAADMHLLMAPEVMTSTEFIGGSLATIDKEQCVECGECLRLCRYKAISDDFVIDPLGCEGCGVCYDLCPSKAIHFNPRVCGEWFKSRTRFGPMIHAQLGIAQENSGRLVSLVRKEAMALAEKTGAKMILTDGPPGIGCPVIASLGGASAAVLVVEPTQSGLHDLERVTKLLKHFRVPGMLIINKYDLYPEICGEIESFGSREQLQLIGLIPFDSQVTRAMVEGRNIIEFAPSSPAATAITGCWKKIMRSPALNVPENFLKNITI
jgi:MinD superfamily P-loop ATPase